MNACLINRFISCLVLLLSFCATTHAEIYKWTDPDGTIHYSDTKPPEEKGKAAPKVVEVELTPIQIMQDGSVTSKENNQTLALFDRLSQNVDDFFSNLGSSSKKNRQGGSAARVEIYTTPWCGACKKAKQWLDQEGVNYTEHNVESDSRAALRMRELGGGGGVPFAVINGATITGFNAQAYASAIGK
jgi:glutaredoxin